MKLEKKDKLLDAPVFKIRGTDIIIKQCDLELVTAPEEDDPLNYGAFLYAKRYECTNLEVVEQHHTNALVVTIRELTEPKTLYSQVFREHVRLKAEGVIEQSFNEADDAEDIIFRLRELEGVEEVNYADQDF